MTRQQLSVQSPRQVPPARQRPVPGARLRRAVDAVLAGLGDGSDKTTAITDTGTTDTDTAVTDSNLTEGDLARFDEVLRTALAWTAAEGDTCRIPAVVRQVRHARASLTHADPVHARAALIAARDGLHVVPNQRMH